jgi:hypothetical protein
VTDIIDVPLVLNGPEDHAGGWRGGTEFPPPASPPVIEARGPVLPVTEDRTPLREPAPVEVSRRTARVRARRRRHRRLTKLMWGLALMFAIGAGAALAAAVAFLVAGGEV